MWIVWFCIILLLVANLGCLGAEILNVPQFNFNVRCSEMLAGNQFSEFEHVNQIAVKSRNMKGSSRLLAPLDRQINGSFPLVKSRLHGELAHVPSVIVMPVNNSYNPRRNNTESCAAKGDESADNQRILYVHKLWIGVMCRYAILLILIFGIGVGWPRIRKRQFFCRMPPDNSWKRQVNAVWWVKKWWENKMPALRILPCAL